MSEVSETMRELYVQVAELSKQVAELQGKLKRANERRIPIQVAWGHRVSPGDSVFITFDREVAMSSDTLQEITVQIREHLPDGVECVILDGACVAVVSGNSEENPTPAA